MIEIPLFVMILAGFVFFLLMVLFVVFFHDIMAFFNPGDYARIEILGMDNSIYTWLQHKTRELTFEFRDAKYNMFETRDFNEDEKKAYDLLDENQKLEYAIKQRVFTSVYKAGRLIKFYYVEGEKDPLDFRNNKLTGSAQLSKQQDKVQLSRLITGGDGIGAELLTRYGFWIICAVIVILLIILFRKPEAVPVK